MDLELLKIVRCPITKSKLEYADNEMLKQLNQQIAKQALHNRVGQLVESPLEAGLVNEDRSVLLPIRNGIAIMVSDQAIVLDASAMPA